MRLKRATGTGISVKLIRFIALCSVLLSPAAWPEPQIEDAGTLGSLAEADSDQMRRKVYIVQLRQPSAVEQFAVATPATMGNMPPPRLNTSRSFSRRNIDVANYAERLEQIHDRVLAAAGSGPQKIYSYRYVLNGFAASLSAAEAQKIEHQPEVIKVWEDEIRPLATNFSPQFLGLFDNTVGLRGTPGLDGEDVIIGVIDGGIAPEHPALTDMRKSDRPGACLSTWATSSFLGIWLCRKYDVNPDVLDYQPVQDWNGICQTGDRFTAANCNNKLIGARFFVDGARASGPIDDNEIFSPRDADGHGTHTATTAAGQKARASIFGTFLGTVEGIAPRARIAVYKACWLRPGDTRATCNTSDLANAIDAAVGDGVHIINYSVGSSKLTVTAPDDIALMAATKAGVLAVVAAGNEGPNLGTIGSPSGAPWVITAAASSRDGEHSLEALQVNTPTSIAGKYAVKEARFTPPLKDNDPITAPLVLADDDDITTIGGNNGTTMDACQALVNSAAISGNIAFIQRGGCEFETKILNAQDAGASAVVIFNIAGAPIPMIASLDTAGDTTIPALMIGQADGNLILAEFDDGQAAELTLDKGFFLTVSDTGNAMGVFSARGPAPVQDILKPDLTAPGINILAGFTPDAVNSVPDENFAFLSGTSMSTPHIAGVAALLRQSHPGWSPAAIKSALMTSARQDIVQHDGSTQAHPFDFGAGHIDPNKANDPGLVFDIRNDEYDAFACGIDSPAMSQARCDELANQGLSFAASDLNLPSITLSRLTSPRKITRRVTNVSEDTGVYTASVEAPAGIAVLVTPSSLTIPPGQSAAFELTMSYQSGPVDLWRFGSLTWADNDEHSVRSVLTARPVSINAPKEILSSGGTGSISFPVEFGYDGIYTPGVHGLDRASIFDGFVDNDPTKTFTFRESDGVTAHVFRDIPEEQLFLRFSMFDQLTDGDDDLDMYLYYCPDNITTNARCRKLGESGEPTSREQIDVLLPGAGTYIVFVHGFETDEVSGGPGANYELLAWQLGISDDTGNMSATGPGLVDAGTTRDVSVSWSNLGADSIYLGAISHNTPQGRVAITLISVQN